MKRDGFLRCYFEAFAYWIGGIALIDLIQHLASIAGWSSDPLDLTLLERVGATLNPIFLIASGFLIVPLFAVILVGERRKTGTSDD